MILIMIDVPVVKAEGGDFDYIIDNMDFFSDYVGFGFKYDDIGFFSEGFAAVEKDGMYGFIDKTGKLVIPTIYEYVQPFSEGLAAVNRDGKWGFIDKKGKMVIPANFYFVSRFNEGLASFDKVLKTEQGVVYESEYKVGIYKTEQVK